MISMKARRHEGTEARNRTLHSRKPHLRTLRRRCGYVPTWRRAFSLIEVLLAIFILGIGVIGIAALFPAGIAQQQRTVDDIMGPIVANNALATLRTKISQQDFGSYEDFDCDPAPGHQPCFPPEFTQIGTVRGDWLWRPPAMLFEDDSATPYIDEYGAIDIFTFEDDLLHSAASTNIPHNPRKYGFSRPKMLVSRGERMYPNSNFVHNQGLEDEPQYYWECMFRKFQGRVLVAIFVYRVTVPGSEDFVYTPQPNPADPSIPYMPYQISLAGDLASDPLPWTGALSATGILPEYATTEVPETDPNPPSGSPGPWASGSNPLSEDFSVLIETNPNHHWQFTGQWLLDQNNNVHRVLAGRENDPSQPVDLVDPIPAMPGPNAYSGRSIYFYDRAPASGELGAKNIVTNLWYLPTRVPVDLDSIGQFAPPGDRNEWVRITPVYLTVEEL